MPARNVHGSRTARPGPETSAPPATHTIRLRRVLRAPPERVYRAFLDPDAMVTWLPPLGFTCKVHAVHARVGGGYRLSFTNFANGGSHSFGGKYVEVIPTAKLRCTDAFEDPNQTGEVGVTITFTPFSCGTELSVVQEGVPAVIPADAC